MLEGSPAIEKPQQIQGWRLRARSTANRAGDGAVKPLRLLDQRRRVEQAGVGVVAAVGLGFAHALLGVAALDVFLGGAVFGEAAAAPGVVSGDVEGEHRRPGGDGEGDHLALEDGERVVEGEDRGAAEVGVEDLERALADEFVFRRIRVLDRAQDADPGLGGGAEEVVEEAHLVGGGFGFHGRGLGEGDRPGDDLAFEGRLVGARNPVGDRLEAGDVPLHPAGGDLDVVDDFAGAGRRRGFRGLTEDDDPQGRRIGSARRRDRDQRRQQAGGGDQGPAPPEGGFRLYGRH